MYDKETFFSAEIYLFSFYMQIDFIYSVCLKKIMTPPAWSTRKAVTPSINFQFIHDPPITFLPPPPPLEINNDRSLSDPRKIGLSRGGGGGGAGIFWKKYFNALADRKTI